MFCGIHYSTVTLSVHLFLTMKLPEHAQILILKLPPTSRPNCVIILIVLNLFVWAIRPTHLNTQIHLQNWKIALVPIKVCEMLLLSIQSFALTLTF